MTVIYETRGRAREYCELAVNLYSGCGHGCTYCYAPNATRTPMEKFRDLRPRKRILDSLQREARALGGKGEKRHILLCFTCDPYQPIESDAMVTCRAINILHFYGLKVAILTKGGMRAARDFDLLDGRDRFGVTLTFVDEEDSRHWEPNAALPTERLKSLMWAKERGIPTWVSLEPVIDPLQTLELIRMSYTYVDHYKVGKMNYLDLDIDWHAFALEARRTLQELGCSYYIKKDLARYLD